MTEAPAQQITLQGLAINEAIAGDGPPILMLHGWGANMDLVWPLAERLIPLGYRVYALDLPGFGKSAEPPQAWTVFDYANFVKQYIDHHELGQVYLFGHSFGGRLSLILGADCADRIIKIALSNSAGLRTKTPLLKQLRLGAYKSVRDGLNKIGAKGLANNLRGWYNGRYGSADFQAVSGVMRETFIHVVNQDLSDYAKRVKPSTLLFWGDNDTETPLWMGRQLEQLIPDAGLVVHKGAGHYAYLDHLMDTVRVMDYFFKNDG